MKNEKLCGALLCNKESCNGCPCEKIKPRKADGCGVAVGLVLTRRGGDELATAAIFPSLARAAKAATSFADARAATQFYTVPAPQLLELAENWGEILA